MTKAAVIMVFAAPQHFPPEDVELQDGAAKFFRVTFALAAPLNRLLLKAAFATRCCRVRPDCHLLQQQVATLALHKIRNTTPSARG